MTTDSGLVPQRGWTIEQVHTAVERVIAEATLDEKVAMMSGHGFFETYAADGRLWGASPYRAGGGCERLGVPALWFTDGPRGVARGESTCFPCSMGRGATFDPDLERRVGEAMGAEIRAQGCNLSGAVCINLLRHPAWGRAQETYGEDSHHLAAMGIGLTEGLQRHNVIATVKHFALNSMENARFTVDVRCDEATLHDIYLAHFREVLAAGAASVMSAYNRVNGEYCAENATLLTRILREEWGFAGFVHSDWIKGVHSPMAAACGLDIENPEPKFFGKTLLEAIERGEVDPGIIDTAVRRILITLYDFLSRPDPQPAYPQSVVASPEHRTLAREVAERSTVLLKNDGILPFDRTQVRRLAVLGRLARLENTGDAGSSMVRAPYVVTPLAGLEQALGADNVRFAEEGDPASVDAALKWADAAVVVVGYTAEDEGEFLMGDVALGGSVGDEASPSRPRGGDRASLELPQQQVDLIRAVMASGNPTVVVMVAGSAVLVEAWIDGAGAVLQTFYAGMEGGHALARLLFGKISPGGRLPFTVARRAEDYPYFDREASSIDYSGLHGYARLQAAGIAPRFPFGHGLSYARIDWYDAEARADDDGIALNVTLRNASDTDADEVVQAYVRLPGDEGGPWWLSAFKRIEVPAGRNVAAELYIPWKRLERRDVVQHVTRLARGRYAVRLGRSAIDETQGAFEFEVDCDRRAG